LRKKLSGVSLRFAKRRGAGIRWGEMNAHSATDVDVVILMLGGNDIDSGMSATQLADRIGHLGRQMVDQYRAQTVVITSQWPRSIPQYNLKAREFASIMEQRHLGDEALTFWL
jgi:lysophospholipase L1-like esterase